MKPEPIKIKAYKKPGTDIVRSRYYDLRRWITAPSFYYINHLLEGFLRMMTSDHEVTGSSNIGNSKEFTIRRLQSRTENDRRAIQLDIEAMPHDNPKQRQPDVTVAGNALA